MKKTLPLLLLVCVILITNFSTKAETILSSGNVSVKVVPSENLFGLSFTYKGNVINTEEPGYPIYLEVDDKKLTGKYDSCLLKDDSLICDALLTTTLGTQISVHDVYISRGNSEIELQRKVDFPKSKNYDNKFISLFGFRTDENATTLTKNEYFIPGVWYKTNFSPEGNLPAGLPQPDDVHFYYRGDRITLPVVMFRNPSNKFTLTLVHKDSTCETVMSDNDGASNEGFQYGSVGIRRQNNIIYTTMLFPGTEMSRKAGKGKRYHPIKNGIKHEYNLAIKFDDTNDYPSALKKSWDYAFDLYNPTVYKADLKAVYEGVIETLLHYYIPSRSMGGEWDAPGFPFQISIETGERTGNPNYSMGFVGMQVATGYYLFRYGIENPTDTRQAREKGEAVLDFWANKSQTSLGYMRGWYDAKKTGTGSWRKGTNMRSITGGIEALLSGWCYAKKNNIHKPAWENTCKQFGDWLVENQNNDGSYYFEYNHAVIQNGKHPITDDNKFLTSNVLRYLVELYIATVEDEPVRAAKYLTAALKAGEWCYKNQHESYTYVASIIDNARTIDGMSGQLAAHGFLSLYDLTQDMKWLVAAEQASKYRETWVYCYDVPVEKGRVETGYPRDRSIIGQQLIAIGHANADLAFAWSGFINYRLYLATDDPHYLHMAKISFHNTKLSMNWDESLYPGKQKGLQLEAHRIMSPRRKGGIMNTLNWNYACNLDGMIRLQDAFGSIDLEEVEKLSPAEKKRLVQIYSKVQSSNYGQKVEVSIANITTNKLSIYPNPVANGQKEVEIILPENAGAGLNLQIYDITGRLVLEENITSTETEHTIININRIPIGLYALHLKGENINVSKKLIIQK